MEERLKIFRPAALCLMGMVLAAAEPAPSVVVSDDPDLHLVTAPSEFDMVGYINIAYGRTAVLVDPWFILTAKHNVEYKVIEGKSLMLHLEDGTHYYYLAEAWMHPTADLAVVRLTSSTELDGYPLYEGTGEAGQEVALVGWGMSGTGYTVGEGGDPDYPRGVNRYGYNKVDSLYIDNDGVEFLRADFDGPWTHGPDGTLGADKEAMMAAGDSGGAALLDVGGTFYLAGIDSYVTASDPDRWPTWGDEGYGVRVSTYVDWIRGVIPDLPATSTGDFNMDDSVDDLDIDSIHAEIRAGGDDLWYDITSDGVVEQIDVDILVYMILGVDYGDSNLDHYIDGLDYTAWADHYGLTGVGWRDGEFSGDGTVDGADYTVWADNYLPPPQAPTGGLDDGRSGAVRVPEPAALSLLVLGALALLLHRRR